MAYTHKTPTSDQSNQTIDTVVVGENSLYVVAIAENNSGADVITAKKRKLRLRTILNTVRVFAAFIAAIGLFTQNAVIADVAFITCLVTFTIAFVIDLFSRFT